MSCPPCKPILEDELPRCDAVIVSDYAKGVINRSLLNTVLERARSGKLVVSVDPQGGQYAALTPGATVITPNHHEALAAARISPQGENAVERAGRPAFGKPGGRSHSHHPGGSGGMTLVTPGRPWTMCPPWPSGYLTSPERGDTVISTLTLGLVSGAEPIRSRGWWPTSPPGVVVGEVGTSAVTAGRLSQALEQDLSSLMRRNN